MFQMLFTLFSLRITWISSIAFSAQESLMASQDQKRYQTITTTSNISVLVINKQLSCLFWPNFFATYYTLPCTYKHAEKMPCIELVCCWDYSMNFWGSFSISFKCITKCNDLFIIFFFYLSQLCPVLLWSLILQSISLQPTGYSYNTEVFARSVYIFVHITNIKCEIWLKQSFPYTSA